MEAMITSEKLAEAGVAEPQAKAHARAHQETLSEAQTYTDESLEEAKKELATKSDIMRLENHITRLESRLESRMMEMELRMEKNLAERDARSVRFAAWLMVAITGVFSIIVKVL